MYNYSTISDVAFKYLRTTYQFVDIFYRIESFIFLSFYIRIFKWHQYTRCVQCGLTYEYAHTFYRSLLLFFFNKCLSTLWTHTYWFGSSAREKKRMVQKKRKFKREIIFNCKWMANYHQFSFCAWYSFKIFSYYDKMY